MWTLRRGGRYRALCRSLAPIAWREKKSANEATCCGRRECFDHAAPIASEGWRKQIGRTPKDRCLRYEDAGPHLWPPLRGPFTRKVKFFAPFTRYEDAGLHPWPPHLSHIGEFYGFARKAQFFGSTDTAVHLKSFPRVLEDVGLSFCITLFPFRYFSM